MADLLRSAQALVVTAEEEFGIAAVESLASGRPVIALRSGGVLETVTEGVTGAFYDDGDDPRALAAAVAGFDPGAVDPAACVTSARRFGVERFQERLRAIVDEAVARGGAAPISERPVGRSASAQIATTWRGNHEDPLNLSRRGHNQRNPVASFGLSVVRGRCSARLISPQRSQA